MFWALRWTVASYVYNASQCHKKYTCILLYILAIILKFWKLFNFIFPTKKIKSVSGKVDSEKGGISSISHCKKQKNLKSQSQAASLVTDSSEMMLTPIAFKKPSGLGGEGCVVSCDALKNVRMSVCVSPGGMRTSLGTLSNFSQNLKIVYEGIIPEPGHCSKSSWHPASSLFK